MQNKRLLPFVRVKPCAEDAFRLVGALQGIPGVKIVTILVGDRCAVYDISVNGEVGYHPDHLPSAVEHVRDALSSRGCIVVRQFIPGALSLDGLPIKALFGLTAEDGLWRAMSAEEVEAAFAADGGVGDDCIFRDIQEFLPPDWVERSP